MRNNKIKDPFWQFLVEQFFIAIEKYHNSNKPMLKKEAYENAKFYQQHINMEIETNKKLPSKELL